MIPPGSGQEGSEIAADFPEATGPSGQVVPLDHPEQLQRGCTRREQQRGLDFSEAACLS